MSGTVHKIAVTTGAVWVSKTAPESQLFSGVAANDNIAPVRHLRVICRHCGKRERSPAIDGHRNAGETSALVAGRS